ncbi:hypothetical protein FOZ76_01810 [Verticiella sediminum]|uniref:Uncharacterized protein n=1 Tax=Verticiella sediminum TaxID=1247510 RepID=A0A556B017_9BURK|nr:ankyrin repeat domain-containing protein [Verticiella sediminum]TSH98513.1 hypothetical protein FOZ76_01810 [Verticiella sediminum]
MHPRALVFVTVFFFLASLGVAVGGSDEGQGGRATPQPPAAQAAGADGITPLQQALMDGRYGAFVDLLRQGADPDAVGWHGYTAVHLAAQHRNKHYLEKLLEHGGDPNAPARRMGRTPIFNAMDSRRPENRDLLIARGADIEYADTSGIRPLRHAANINDADSVWCLLQLGADPTATDNLGATFQSSFFRPAPGILSWSARKQRRQVIELLKERGVALDPKAERF